MSRKKWSASNVAKLMPHVTRLLIVLCLFAVLTVCIAINSPHVVAILVILAAVISYFIGQRIKLN